MNPDLHQCFSFLKPYCDSIMKGPTPEKLNSLLTQLPELTDNVLEEMHLYILFPLVTHLRSDNLKGKYELQRQMVDAMRIVLEKVTLNSTEIFHKYHTCLLNLIYDKTKPGVVADIPEELKHSLIQCFALLMLNMEEAQRVKLFELYYYVPLIAQTVFICVHVAKQDKLRVLRLSAINCVLAYTATHPSLVKNYQITNKKLEENATDFICGVLPGVVAALQDVATDADNPGHAVVTAAINAIHRIVCLAMSDRLQPRPSKIYDDDFSRLVAEKKAGVEEAKKLRDIPKRKPEWFLLAGAKLRIVTDSLANLRDHSAAATRRELAVYCSRVLFECSRSMQPSIGTCLDVLLSLSHDPFPEVQSYSSAAISRYMSVAFEDRNGTYECLNERMQATLVALPRVLNNIEMERKVSSLNQLLGYITLLAPSPRMAGALGGGLLTGALLEAARIQPCAGVLARSPGRVITTQHNRPSPWGTLVHLDDSGALALRGVCMALGGASGGALLADALLEAAEGGGGETGAALWLLNCFGSSPQIDPEVTKSILNKYIEESMWELAFEVAAGAIPVNGETSTWERDSVPGLYEGTIETRVTGISYATPRVPKPRQPGLCRSLAEAEANMLAACLLAEGVGLFAKKLGDDFQPYLLKTLCMVLERVGSSYEMLRLAGLQSLCDMATACGLKGDVASLLRDNADYITSQLTTRLKKSWHCESALQILTVVMEYSDATILDCLYGIVTDVLFQSCDKHRGRDLSSYLQVFLTFIMCIQKWFPQNVEKEPDKCECCIVSLFKTTEEFIKAHDDAEKLVEECSKSAEEMYEEDQRRKEDEVLDYDDTVVEEKKPLPQHVTLTVTILRRCLNFIPSKRRDEKLLALCVAGEGIKILKPYEDELLPLVHQVWGPLVGRFSELSEPVVLRASLDVLVTLAKLAKDFIRHRTVKEVLPNLYKYVQSSAKESRLKDVGSYYRQTQAFKLQMAAITALPHLAAELGLEAKELRGALDCVAPYLSNKQPKPLQTLAVDFFRRMLYYDFGATWSFFREFCGNDSVVKPPTVPGIKLEPFKGSPFEPDSEFSANVELIFGVQ